MSAVKERLTRLVEDTHAAEAVAIITPTIKGREHLLSEACQSVVTQTVEVAHHIACDDRHAGPAVIRNAVLNLLGCEYVGFLDDDDLLDPDHVETLLAALETGADLAFSWYRREGSAPETPRVEAWDDYAYGTMLGGRNIIPVTVLARRDALLAAGGFRAEDRFEDYALWMRMLELDAQFVCVPRETWTYRCLGNNRTWETP